MHDEHENPFDTLCELRLNCSSDLDLLSSLEIRAELSFANDVIDVGAYDIEVSLNEAILFVEPWGASIEPGSKFAEGGRQALEARRTERRRSVLQRGRGLSLSGQVSAQAGASAGVTTKSDGSDTHEVEIEIEQKIDNRFVNAISGNRWRVRESDINGASMPLEGSYITNEVLCALKPNDRTNTVSIDAIVFARKKDFLVKPEGNSITREYRERVHKNKFMAAIVARSIAEYAGQSEEAKTTGRIILSRSTLEGDLDVS